MTRVVILCGTAYSGKSTLACALEERCGFAVVSLDAINAERGLWGGDGLPIAEWERSHAEAIERVRALVTAGRDARRLSS
ncbi:MAG: hypothetical protein ACYC7A_00115 [Thermoanaerobaculia bacterium]